MSNVPPSDVPTREDSSPRRPRSRPRELEHGKAPGLALKTATDVAYQGLRDGILRGQYQLGMRLNEVDLAEDLGVSRTPVREALRRLAAEGLIDIAFNRGAQVATWSAADLVEVFELRAVLESYGASRAAERITADQLALLARLCDDEGAAISSNEDDRVETVIQLNATFHSTIVEAAENGRLLEMVLRLIEIPSVLRVSQHTDRHLEWNWHDHMILVEALTNRNGDWAASLMRAHMLREKDTLLREGDTPERAGGWLRQSDQAQDPGIQSALEEPRTLGVHTRPASR